MLTAMALVFDAWGVDRQRADLLAAYAQAERGQYFAGYLGHNIGALLVDRNGKIICFALNRNVELNSTLEHAEERSIRGAINIANAARRPTATPSWSFGKLLSSDRLYATLEPCAQCAGIMSLANIGNVIYAQDDPSQHNVLNILYNLGRQPGSQGAPLPIRGTFLPVWDQLSTAYAQFVTQASADSRTGVTSFLQTPAAYSIFRRAAAILAAFQPAFPANVQALTEARAFRARWHGSLRRGFVPG
jgi:tRNA(Arg) A34 adenosine deaminase TadA